MWLSIWLKNTHVLLLKVAYQWFFDDRPELWLVVFPYTVPLSCCLQSRSIVLFGAQQSSQLMPPGMQRHICPGAMQRRLLVAALWLAFYKHIWLRKISVLLDPRKIHITCTSRNTKTTSLGNAFRSVVPGKKWIPAINRFIYVRKQIQMWM